MTSPAFEDRANCLSKTPILGLRAQDFSTPATSCLLLRDTTPSNEEKFRALEEVRPIVPLSQDTTPGPSGPGVLIFGAKRNTFRTETMREQQAKRDEPSTLMHSACRTHPTETLLITTT
jgi:hypothetical protein